MDLISAIKSSKRFRRKTSPMWIDAKGFKTITLQIDDILADDWEIEKIPREFYICKYPDGVIVSLSEKDAAIQKVNGYDVFKVREVLDN
jgi:hypothetical protein